MIQLCVGATSRLETSWLLTIRALAILVFAWSSLGLAQEPISIVTTTTILADTAKIIAGPSGRIASLMGPGVDPHLYKASPNDLRTLSQATIIFHHGLHLEGTIAEALKRLASRKLVVAVADALPAEKLRAVSGTGATYDPHVWFDVSLWMICADTIRATLARHDPQHAHEYSRRFEELRSSLSDLHSWTRQQIQTIPPAHRLLITAHDAFGYFGKAYGLEVLAIQGVSTESEASLRSINELVSTIVARRVPAIFVENTISPKTVEALIQGAQARGHTVKVGGILLGDSLGDAGTPEETYIGTMRHNVQTITAALADSELRRSP
jgi:manganese/zinc/iron transport system substrate-binding protein